jgi:uncharacterized protein Smg (DUF494 family)
MIGGLAEMVTLTEKQEAMKEILGSKESIRKFVRDEGIHTEDLENYASFILAVVLEEKEAKKNKIKLDAKKEQERLIVENQKLRDTLALAGFNAQEIDETLGAQLSLGRNVDSGSKKRGASKGIVRAKYIFPLLDGTESEPMAVQGNRKNDSPAMLACVAAGYDSLSAWVKGDERVRKA